MGGGYAFSVLEEGPTRPRDPITEGQLKAVGKLGLSFGSSRRSEAINGCKTRVVETLFLERLLTTVRDLFLAEL